MSQEEREQLKQATIQLDAGLSTSAPTAVELVTLNYLSGTQQVRRGGNSVDDKL